uniref:Uncharacterized protein n=1 Tax=Oryza glumipatula TaxID=40148 RepID=A0A0E0BUN6_9ORYZ
MTVRGGSKGLGSDGARLSPLCASGLPPPSASLRLDGDCTDGMTSCPPDLEVEHLGPLLDGDASGSPMIRFTQSLPATAVSCLLLLLATRIDNLLRRELPAVDVPVAVRGESTCSIPASWSTGRRRPVPPALCSSTRREGEGDLAAEDKPEGKDGGEEVLGRGWFMVDEIGMDILTIALPAVLALTTDPITALISTSFVGHAFAAGPPSVPNSLNLQSTNSTVLLLLLAPQSRPTQTDIKSAHNVDVTYPIDEHR